MKLSAGIAVLIAATSFLTGCKTTTDGPDISSVQPTQQMQNQEKIQQALQS